MNPNAVNLYNKALELIKLDRLAQAKRNLEKSLKLQPNFFQAHTSLGTIYEKNGYIQKALDHYFVADKIFPNSPVILTNIGNAYHKLGENEKSIQFYSLALKADPKYLGATLNLLTISIKSNDLKLAHEITLRHENDETLFLALTSIFFELVQNRQLPEYRDLKKKVLLFGKSFSPTSAIASKLITVLKQATLDFCPFHNLLVFLTTQDEDSYSLLADFILNISKQIGSCSASSNYFLALQNIRSGQLVNALSYIKKSIDHGCPDSMRSLIIDILYGLNKPEDALLEFNQLKNKANPSPVSAGLLFKCHDFSSGWEQYSGIETKLNNLVEMNPTANMIKAKNILLLSFQGIGDVVMFLSCLKDFIAITSPKTISLNCNPRLHPLISRSFDCVNPIWHPELFDPKFIDNSHEVIRSHDLCIKFSSICSLVRLSIEDFYPQHSYLLPNPDLKTYYKHKINSMPHKISVGFSWKGGAFVHSLNKKNIPLEDFLPLFMTPGINWINLQYGDVSDEISSFNETHGTNLIHFDEIDPLKEIDTQFALISNLDLVIQTSNTSIHFAGSQGIPTWVMISEPSDFRWFDGIDKDMSPWYENMRVCRKELDDTWSDYIASLAKELQAKLDSLK